MYEIYFKSHIVCIFQSLYGTEILRFILLFFFPSKLHLKDKKRFERANQDSGPGLNLEEFIAFEHPEEVDYMTVRSNSTALLSD